MNFKKNYMKKLFIILAVATLFSCSKDESIINTNSHESITYNIKLINFGTYYDVSLTKADGQVFYSEKGVNTGTLTFDAQSNMTLDMDCDSTFYFVDGVLVETIKERRIIYLK